MMDLNGDFIDSFQFHPDLIDQYLLPYSTDGLFSTQATEFFSDFTTPSYDPQGPSAPTRTLQGPFTATQDLFHSDITDQYLLSYSTDGLFSTQGSEFLSDFTTPSYDLQGQSAPILTSMDQNHKGEGGDSYRSDEVSDGNSDDQSYHPSPSPSNGQCSPFSYSVDNLSTRESSESTLGEESPRGSPSDDGEGYKRNNRTRRKSKGKAKGSAALALAKLTLKNNKPLTGPFGTFVPYPPELNEGPEVITCSGEETTGGVRLGRKRRNGHIPPPVLVPDLVKRSRGRKVPSNRLQVGTLSEVARPFVCEVKRCGASFTRREHLKRHSRSLHTNEKEYVCPEPSCGKSFNRRDNLAQHSRIHLIDVDSCTTQGPTDSDGSTRVGSP